MILLNLIFLILFASAAQALTAETQLIELGQDRVAVFESAIFDPSQTTFIFLPGIHRALEQSDLVIQLLHEQRVNHVSLSFSAHPRSVVEAIRRGKNPSFKDLNLQDLKNEVHAVVNALGLQHPVPVGLSYSSAVTSLFKTSDFPVVIDFAPLGRQQDDAQFLQSYYEAFQGMNAWNPWAQAWLQQLKEQAYHNYWSQELVNLKHRYPELFKNSMATSTAVGGMIALSKAVENFELEKQDYRQSSERIYVLAENESAARLRRQTMAIKAYESQTGKSSAVFLIQKSGHTIPTEAPLAYLRILQNFLSGNIDASGLKVLDLEGNEISGAF